MDTSKQHIEAAMDWLEQALYAGVSPVVSRGRIGFPGWKDPPPATMAGLLALLDVPRKDWAMGRREVVVIVGPAMGDLAPNTVAAIELLDRRTIGRVYFCQDGPVTDDFATFIGEPTALIVPQSQGFSQRAVLGLLLADRGIGKGRLDICELPWARMEEERVWLAGSVFLDTPVPSESLVLARALRLTLAARSIRRGAGKEYRQGYYTSIAAKTLAKRGETFEGIRRRLGVAGTTLGRWLEQTQDLHPPPTAAQVAYVRSLLQDLPFLIQALPVSWEDNREAIGRFLDAVSEPAAAWLLRWRELGAAARLRRALGQGEPLEAALSISGLDRVAALVLLGHHAGVMRRDLEMDIARTTGVDIDLRDPSILVGGEGPPL